MSNRGYIDVDGLQILTSWPGVRPEMHISSKLLSVFKAGGHQPIFWEQCSGYFPSDVLIQVHGMNLESTPRKWEENWPGVRVGICSLMGCQLLTSPWWHFCSLKVPTWEGHRSYALFFSQIHLWLALHWGVEVHYSNYPQCIWPCAPYTRSSVVFSASEIPD